jgi:hypothetical protein
MTTDDARNETETGLVTGDIEIFQRVCWGENAVNAYSEDKQGGLWGDLYDEAETVLTDLLADLMHYAEAHKIDFQTVLERARTHHDAEVQP